MSENRLPKIEPSLIARIAILIGLFVLAVVNIRIIIDNLQHLEDIDQEIVNQANPSLNKKFIIEAVNILESFQDSELTTIFTSDTLESEGLNQQPVIVDIQNASGITGAAASLAEILSQKNYQIGTISTAPSRQIQTLVLFKEGREENAQALVSVLQEQDWPVGAVEKTEELAVDITIILGK
jgi:hypothetical protein